MVNNALPMAVELAKNIKVDVKLEGKYAAIAVVATVVTAGVSWVACTAINAHSNPGAMLQSYTVV